MNVVTHLAQGVNKGNLMFKPFIILQNSMEEYTGICILFVVIFSVTPTMIRGYSCLGEHMGYKGSTMKLSYALTSGTI